MLRKNPDITYCFIHYNAILSKIKTLIYENESITSSRALTPLLGNGAGAHGIGKIGCILTKIGKFDIVLMYDVSIARLIPIINLL